MGPKKKILVIDDERAIGEMIAEASQLVGLECQVTSRAVDFEAALNEDVQAVFVDLMMPDVDGIEVVRRMGDRHSTAGVVLLSGFDSRVLKAAGQVAESLGLRVLNRLEKPFALRRLIQVLETIRDETVTLQAGDAIRHYSSEQIAGFIEEGQWTVHYQPQIDLRSRRTVGLEALARLSHPVQGILGPEVFLPSLERGGRLEELTEVVLAQSLSTAVGLRTVTPVKLSVNLAPSSLTDLSLPDHLLQLTQAHGLPASRLVIEITESGLLSELGRSLDVLSRLRMKGFGLSVDDYGTGYSSMAQLQQLPATELKIDHGFVREIATDPVSRSMVSKTILLAHDLGLTVVAEGNETLQQTSLLEEWNCDVVQGFYFGKPMAADQLLAWLHKRGELEMPTPGSGVPR